MVQKKKKKVRRQVSRAAVAVTEGLFSHALDLALWCMVYLAELSTPFETYGKAWRAASAADRFLNKINYEVIKNAIITAKKRRYLKSSPRHAWPKITEEGKRRLSSVIPRYDEVRIWDGRMHIITYDIPEKQSDDRYELREFLRRIGCGRLQDSVWITPYNPIDTIRSFIQDRSLGGTIIISDMGSDGSIGEEDLRGLIVRIYDLERINKQYEEWFSDMEEQDIDHWSIIRYLSILKLDPQLPFELLPPWWKGDQAYKKVEPFLKNYVVLFPTGGKIT